jgi:hypothetical protein
MGWKSRSGNGVQQARVFISFDCFPEIAKRSIATVVMVKAVQERLGRESTKYLIDLWQSGSSSLSFWV